MNHDNQKDAQLPTTSPDHASPESAQSPAIKRELDDAEIAAVSGGTPTPINGPVTGWPPRMAR